MLQLQFRVLCGSRNPDDVGQSFVYRLGDRGETYIGQGKLVRQTGAISGGVARHREHWKVFFAAKRSQRRPDPARYRALLRREPQACPPILFSGRDGPCQGACPGVGVHHVFSAKCQLPGPVPPAKIWKAAWLPKTMTFAA